MSKGKRLREQRQTPPPPPVGKNRSTDRRLWIAIIGVVTLAVIAAIAIAVTQSKGTAKPVNEAALPALQDGPVPWGTSIADLANRLQVLGLPALSREGSVLHIHQHIDMFLNGKPVTVAGGIGINGGSFISPIHTHDTTGVIHVESPTQQHFSLGQFFAIWGVRFTPTRIGGYRAYGTHPLRFYVNGKPFTGDPTRLALTSHEEIAIVIGKGPAHVPASYAFASGQ